MHAANSNGPVLARCGQMCAFGRKLSCDTRATKQDPALDCRAIKHEVTRNLSAARVEGFDPAVIEISCASMALTLMPRSRTGPTISARRSTQAQSQRAPSAATATVLCLILASSQEKAAAYARPNEADLARNFSRTQKPRAAEMPPPKLRDLLDHLSRIPSIASASPSVAPRRRSRRQASMHGGTTRCRCSSDPRRSCRRESMRRMLVASGGHRATATLRAPLLSAGICSAEIRAALKRRSLQGRESLE